MQILLNGETREIPGPTTVRELLADLSIPAYFTFDNGAYQHESGPLNEDLRQSLVDDLRLSERSTQVA